MKSEITGVRSWGFSLSVMVSTVAMTLRGWGDLEGSEQTKDMN